MTLLSVREASKHFGALRAVNEVSFDLEPGEICGLVGPNGSGKTTLVNVITGVLSPTGGSVGIAGVESSQLRSHAIARLGVSRTFQLIRLLRFSSVRENVRMGLLPVPSKLPLRSWVQPAALGADRRRRSALVDEAIERLDLEHVSSRLVRELPFGLERRVELARALVSKPQLLILDEPAAGVTAADMRDLNRIIQEESSRGCGVLLVDHNLRFVLDTCPRLVVMNFGQLIYDGTSAAAVDEPRVREAYVGT
jgi:ABC-type branched-subunit amino acid transport system ATPase component